MTKIKLNAWRLQEQGEGYSELSYRERWIKPRKSKVIRWQVNAVTVSIKWSHEALPVEVNVQTRWQTDSKCRHLIFAYDLGDDSLLLKEALDTEPQLLHAYSRSDRWSEVLPLVRATVKRWAEAFTK